jgi:DNA-binding MarR family transcriptional regulator
MKDSNNAQLLFRATIGAMAETEPSKRILEELGHVLRHLTRISGGPDDGPALTATQRLALFELLDDGPLRLNDLAARMGTTPPTASRAVDALDDLGMVERTSDPTDRRALQIQLTPSGRRAVDERKARVYAAVGPAVAGLPAADRRQLADLLARLAEQLKTLGR